MNIYEKFDKDAEICMRINDKVSATLFNTNMQLYPNTKELCSRIYHFLEKNINLSIPNTQIIDVIIQGGLSSYIYHPQSDVDLIVLCENNNMDKESFSNLLINLGTYLSGMGYNFKLPSGETIDYSIREKEDIGATSGIYSIISDTWVRKPTKGNFNFSKAELIKQTYNISIETENFINSLPKESNQYISIDNCNKMRDYFENIKKHAIASAKSNGNEYNLDYTALKLLRNTGELHNMRDFIISMYNNNFIKSLPTKQGH